MGYRVLGRTEDLFQGHGARRGLEGPFIFANGRILYYDPREGSYWDPRTDWYVDHDEVHKLQQDLVNRLSKS